MKPLKSETELAIGLLAVGIFAGGGIALGLWSFCAVCAVVAFVALLIMEREL